MLKKHIKKFLVAVGILGSMALAAGDLAVTTENELISSIETRQANYLSAGKYRHIPLTDIKISGENVKYQVNEYQKPDGRTGYWIVLQKTAQISQLNATTSQMETVNKVITKSIGYGSNATDLTKNWK